MNGSAPSAFVLQAAGMISVQAGCTVDEAETRLRDRAALQGVLVDDMAREVIERRLRFDGS